MQILPIDDSLRFGDLNPDGSIKRDVRICAISGKPIEPGDAMMRVLGTSKFYRVKAPFLWPQSAANFALVQPELEARARSAAATSPASPSTQFIKPPATQNKE